TASFSVLSIQAEKLAVRAARSISGNGHVRLRREEIRVLPRRATEGISHLSLGRRNHSGGMRDRRRYEVQRSTNYGDGIRSRIRALHARPAGDLRLRGERNAARVQPAGIRRPELPSSK